jgi:hypothetical protein
MSNHLEWIDSDFDYKASATVDGRVYRLFRNGDGRWFVTLSHGGNGNMIRGWARTPDEAKRIAEKWERVLTQYEFPNERPEGYWEES